MKRLYADWIPYMKAYRIYDPKRPQQTIAYEDDLDVAEEYALENGYDGIVKCDDDTKHIECY